MLEMLRIESRSVLRDGLWKLAAAGLGVVALTFFAGALALGAAQVMPNYAALLLSGIFLALMALGCVLIATRAPVSGAHEEPIETTPPVNAALSLISKETAENPTKAMIAGLAAGAAYGLLDSLTQKSRK